MLSARVIYTMPAGGHWVIGCKLSRRLSDLELPVLRQDSQGEGWLEAD
jgi:hypothetical protein